MLRYQTIRPQIRVRDDIGKSVAVPIGDSDGRVSPLGLAGTLDGAVRARLDPNSLVACGKELRRRETRRVAAQVLDESDVAGSVARHEVFVAVPVPVQALWCDKSSEFHEFRLLAKIARLGELWLCR